MIDAWWLVCVSGLWSAAMIYLSSVSYRMGIWDGARNQFLPHVQREIRFYDGAR